MMGRIIKDEREKRNEKNIGYKRDKALYIHTMRKLEGIIHYIRTLKVQLSKYSTYREHIILCQISI